MANITKGMVVELISGGPRMSVSDTGDYSGMGLGPKEGASCVWFDAKQNRCEKVFDIAILKESVEPAGGSMRLTRA